MALWRLTMSMQNMKVGTRLGLGFGVVLTLLLLVAALGLLNMQAIYGKLDKIVSVNVAKTELVQDMSESVHIVARVTRTVVLLSEESAMRAELKNLEHARATYDEAFAALQKFPSSAQGGPLRARIEEARKVAHPLTDQVLELAMANKDAEATALLMSKSAPATQRWQDAMDQFLALQKQHNKDDAAAAVASYERARLMMLVLCALALVVGIAASITIARGLVRQLGGEPDYAAMIAGRIASGDLTVEVATHGDEGNSMLHAMKQMRDSLVGIVREVRGGTENIAAASAQIATGNQDLSARTEEQASSLEETASSMEQLTSAVRQNGEHARQANQLAASASSVAQQGGNVVAQVVETMASINASSHRIVDIISVIDGIAFQTNILALNAAVEAARAGEQGRGFAVVASEVRNLAQRSATAAKEIKALIGDSVEQVEAGSKLVAQAGDTMREVVTSVQRVTDIMAEISHAGEEQGAGIEQINQAVSEMDNVTQQNAALVEEAAAAAEALKQQADQLERVVSIFKLDGHAAPPQRKAMAMAPRSAARPALVAPARTARKTANGGADWEEF